MYAVIQVSSSQAHQLLDSSVPVRTFTVQKGLKFHSITCLPWVYVALIAQARSLAPSNGSGLDQSTNYCSQDRQRWPKQQASADDISETLLCYRIVLSRLGYRQCGVMQ
jgi:hypothetical protein